MQPDTPLAANAQIFVRPDEKADFDAFESNLIAELKPAGQLQCHIFDQLLHAAWNIRRCFALEAEIQNEAIAKGILDALLDDELARKLDRVYRYKKTHEATQRAALKELRQLQTEDLFRRTVNQFEEESALPPTSQVLDKVHRAIANHRKAALDKTKAKVESFITAPFTPIRQ